ncbi:MAG: NAD-dependent DNA ligase LigA [Deltaproteobacteria bacterium]|nr:NAD-dependent DNA ligase LigA [Deltaproteobacteria bacterium]
MDAQARRKRIQEIEKLLVHHKQLYYRGRAEISDAAYDALEDELRDLDPSSYALQVVGYEVGEQKIRHERPMLSLDKSREVEEIIGWMAGQACAVSYKMDGSSASLVYEAGKFVLAKTRGDGTFGENLTRYFRTIRFPGLLFDPHWRGRDVEIRGELCISKARFDELADEMARRGLGRPKSIRNIVAGLLHRETELDLCAYLDFLGYEIFSDELGLETETQKFDLLASEGFATPVHERLDSPDAFPDFVERYQRALESHAYLTDGLVVAIDDLAAQLARGFTAHHPKGKIAFKFKSDTAVTSVRSIEVDVGRTGKLTFVGQVDPVELSGATVQRVTLHNAKYIEDHQINAGCRIEITRSGEVIPKHEQTIETAGAYRFPTACPRCGTALVRSDTGVDLVCPDPACPSRSLGRIANWIDVVDIEFIGDETLAKLAERGLVEGIADLYRLRVEDMEVLEGLGRRSARNIVESIASSKRLSLAAFLTALGIEGLGKGVAKLIVQAFPSVAALEGAGRDELLAISGIGEVLADNLQGGLTSFGWPLLDELSGLGVEIADEGSAAAAGGQALAGKTFVITGTLSRPRKEIQRLIEQHGGKVAGSVSKQTSYLVCNQASSSSKYKKARELDVAVLTEEELDALVQA